MIAKEVNRNLNSTAKLVVIDCQLNSCIASNPEGDLVVSAPPSTFRVLGFWIKGCTRCMMCYCEVAQHFGYVCSRRVLVYAESVEIEF